MCLSTFYNGCGCFVHLFGFIAASSTNTTTFGSLHAAVRCTGILKGCTKCLLRPHDFDSSLFCLFANTQTLGSHETCPLYRPLAYVKVLFPGRKWSCIIILSDLVYFSAVMLEVYISVLALMHYCFHSNCSFTGTCMVDPI